MLKDDILQLLTGREEPLSGQAMSARLGVSRAAVWKGIEALRREGYQVESRPAVGYLLTHAPDLLTPAALTRKEGVVGRQVLCLPTVDSTNNECRRRAAAGAPEGLVVVADEQTGGKGRRGRSFQSLPGKGLYLSVLLRPRAAAPEELSQLTAWAAVAVCRAAERCTGVPCQIKWVNDVLMGRKKLCGILTELSLDDDGRPDSVVVGIGVNIGQTPEDFGPQLAPIATSLCQHTGSPPTRAAVAAALMEELEALRRDFPRQREGWLEDYRSRCVTAGQVRLLRPDGEAQGEAVGVNDDFTLRVRFPDGRLEAVSTGEVSVRGLLGYV